jgi:hypothetical protein
VRTNERPRLCRPTGVPIEYTVGQRSLSPGGARLAAGGGSYTMAKLSAATPDPDSDIIWRQPFTARFEVPDERSDRLWQIHGLQNWFQEHGRLLPGSGS